MIITGNVEKCDREALPKAIIRISQPAQAGFVCADAVSTAQPLIGASYQF